MRMEVNNQEMLNVRRIIKAPIIWSRGPVVQLGVEAAKVNCYLTLKSDEIHRPYTIPVAIPWAIKITDCIYMKLLHVLYHRCSRQIYEHYVLMYLNSEKQVKTHVMSERYSAPKIQSMLELLADCDISELLSSEIRNTVQRNLFLQCGLLVNERIFDYYYKSVDFLYKKCE